MDFGFEDSIDMFWRTFILVLFTLSAFPAPFPPLALPSGNAFRGLAFYPTYDALIDFQTSSVGGDITASDFSSTTHGTSFGTWTVFPALAGGLRVSSTATAFLTAKTVGGVGYMGSTDRGYEARLDQITNYVKIDLTSHQNNFSMGFFVMWGSSGGTFQTVDLVQFNDESGGYFVLQLPGVAATFNVIRAHGNDGGSGVGSSISVSESTIYWVSMQYIRNATRIVKVYASGVLISTSTIGTVTDSPCASIFLGRVDNHGGGQPPDTSWVRFSNFIFDTTTTGVIAP